MKINRRDFLKLGATAALGATAVPALLFGEKKKRNSSVGGVSNAAPLNKGQIPTRPLGKTGVMVTLFGLGGQATLEDDGMRNDAVKIINRAYELGVNYFDTATAYGPSQGFYGEAMKGWRDKIFLATKTWERSREGSLRLLDDSLKKLKTDHLDLWQLHNLRHMEELDVIFGKGGALEALLKARDEKIVRFLGITGHYDPAVLKKAARRFDFDTVLVALNAADRHHKSFIEEFLPTAQAKNMGIIGMKVPARGRIFRKDGVRTMKEACDYVWTLPVSTAIVGCSTIAELEENVRLAKEFKPLTAKEMRKLEKMTEHSAEEATFFKNWG